MKNFKNWLENKIEIWLDDERNPEDSYIIDNFNSRKNMVWVKTIEEAIELIKNKEVDFISFDNDLGYEKEGKHLAKWIEEQAFLGNIKPIKWQVHSQNTIGRKEIITAMQNADKFWNNQIKEMAGSVDSIVSCKDLKNPNFQVQGALSNLGCKIKNKILKMKFNK